MCNKMLRSLRTLLAVPLIVLGLSAGTASALTFDLNQLIIGASVTSTWPYSFGSIELTDNLVNTDSVDITVNLTDPGLKLLSFFLNYGGAGAAANLTINGTGVLTDKKANGYPGLFDLRFPPHGNLGNVSFFAGSIALAGIDLNAADFDFTDSTGRLFAAAHIAGFPNDCSIWVGNGTPNSPPSAPPVPEPGTIMLLGSGLAWLGFWGKKRRNV